MSDLIGRTPAGPMQAITLGETAVSLKVPAGATLALISVENGSIRLRDDGEPPSPSRGHPLASSMLYGGSLSAIQFIAAATSDAEPRSGGAVITVSYYR
jgi:hypothetical protein